MRLSRLINSSLHLMVAERKRQLLLLLVLMVLASFAEALSIGAVIPLLNVVTNPSLTLSEIPLGGLMTFAGSNERETAIIFIVSLFVLAVFISGAIRLALLYLSTRVSFLVGKDFSQKIFQNSICSSYESHLESNSSEIVSGATEKVNIYIYQFLLPLLTITSNLFIFTTLCITLLFVAPIVFFAATGFFASIYLLLTRYIKGKLDEYSREVSFGSTRVVQILQQGFTGIRDVLLSNSQDKFLDKYQSANTNFRLAQASSSFLGGAPRFVIEPLGMILIALVCFVLVYPENSSSNVVGIVGVFVVAAQRMLPLMQQAFASFVQIRAGQESVSDVIGLMERQGPLLSIDALGTRDNSDINSFEMKQGIKMSDVSFRYRSGQYNVIDDLNLNIPAGSRIGIVGKTGSGKSTLLDLLVGLLSPSAGSILIDGKKMGDLNMPSWRAQIGYVSQSVFLSDSTIAENIAFGSVVGSDELVKVKSAAKKAQIAEFIEQLPNGYSEMVGEAGVRLSGGQRQRIAVARALYRDVNLIIFDEATSALDEATERNLMEVIYGLESRYTVIIVAHRASTLAACDAVYEITNGTINLN